MKIRIFSEEDKIKNTYIYSNLDVALNTQICSQ